MGLGVDFGVSLGLGLRVVGFGVGLGEGESVANIYPKIAPTRRVAGTRLTVMGCVIVCAYKGKGVRRGSKNTFCAMLRAVYLYIFYRYNRGNCEYAIFSTAAGVTTATGVPFL